MKTLQKVPSRFGRLDQVRVDSMPSYGAMPVVAAKWSPVSGWHYDVRDEFGGVWNVGEDHVSAA